MSAKVLAGVHGGIPALVERANDQNFERLMCEVEFWEVFLRKELGFLEWCPKVPLVDCRIANLDS